jgi:hypothetical protein
MSDTGPMTPEQAATLKQLAKAGTSQMHLSRISRAPGNVHSADGSDGTLKPVVVRYQANVSHIYFRADAAFAMPEVWRIPV